MDQIDIRRRINSELAKALHGDLIPWRQPWCGYKCCLPVNVVTYLPYRDINPSLLNLTALRHGYISRWWGTRSEWKVFGCKIKPEAVGVRIYRHHDAESGISLLHERVVYNLDGVEGGSLDKLRPKRRLLENINKLSEQVDECGTRLWSFDSKGLVNVRAERIIKSTSAVIKEQPDGEPFYCRDEDYITLPSYEQFVQGGGPQGYYQILFHELIHWSESRMGWLADGRRNIKDRYAIGELRAEMGSAYLCGACGLKAISKNTHAKYLKIWLKLMHEDDSFIFAVAKDASDAADYVLSFCNLSYGDVI